MARTVVVAGNWKMNMRAASGIELARAVAATRRQHPAEGFEVACIPPYPYLHHVGEALAGSNVKLGAQDVAPTDDGAYTGDVSAAMLSDIGCQYAVIGHSERREHHGEGEPLLARKVACVRGAGLVPIICCGEPLQVRQRGSQEDFVREQVLGLFAGPAKEDTPWTGFVVAYEPIWAIGTGEVATPTQAQTMCRMIREVLSGLCAKWADITILYGGSVNADNAADLIREADVDGFLVGGASLKADAFSSIIGAAAASVG